MAGIIISVYASLVLSVIFHELGHYMTAKVFKIEVYAIYLGINSFSVKIGKVYISPIIYTGGVSVDEEALVKSGKKGITCFFLSGMAMNLLLAILFLQIGGLFAYFTKYVNIGAVCLQMLFFVNRESDIYKLIKYMKKSRS